MGLAAVLLILGLLIVTCGPYNFGLTQLPAPAAEPANFSNTHAVGALLFTQYVYAFEIAGMLLLAAMVAAITLAHRPPHKRKIQRPASQIDVRPEDRVRLVKGV